MSIAGTVRAQVYQTPPLDTLIPPGSTGGGTAFQPGVTVTSRARPDYDSSGVTLGNFTIRPQMSEGVGYDSNVAATSKPQGSPVIETYASLAASGDWATSNVQAELTVDNNRFPTQDRQSYTNWSASIGGSHQFGQDVASAWFSHQALTQTPASLDVPQLDSALPYTIDIGSVAYRANFNRFFVTPAVQVASYNFTNGTVQGVPYVQTFQDRVVVTPSVTLGYELSPRRDLVMVIRNATANFSNQVPGIPAQNYNDTAVLGGFDYDADGVIRYRVLVGYEIRTFQSEAYKNIEAPVAEASAIWTPTGLTTVTGTIARQIEDSSDATTAGYTETYVQARVDHEYLPNVLLRASAGAYFTGYQSG
ncbi:MAG TPA: outer membrane beta-barrel protein, partial [Micropepsaceae bacterium]|nr:outer membrane beta-barrel protein [Micropepsaceae bacterium]